MKLHVLNTGYFKLDGGAMFGVVPKSIWNKIHPADENNLCNWAMRCLLVEEDDRLILIDTGIGDKQTEKFFSHYHLSGSTTLEDALKKSGFAMQDVTDVILTHLHFDHCGGAVKYSGGKLVPTFPSATYWSNERHWNWATEPNDREKASFLKENILPLQEHNRLKFIGVSDRTRFSQHIEIRFAYGHTEAMMLPEIDLNGRKLVYVADLIPSAAHIPIPYVMAYDMFPLTTLKEKKQFLEEAAANKYVLFFEHDEKHECAVVEQTEKGIRTAELFPLNTIFV
jgi:glyoxylase-like metal-dependent hydrolase (beta-lactamase superfamily II)